MALDNSPYVVARGLFPRGMFDEIYQEIKDKIIVRRFLMRGVECKEGRAGQFFALENVRMRYTSNREGKPEMLEEGSVLARLIHYVNDTLRHKLNTDLPEFNSVFVNYYADGDDYISYHSDKMTDQDSTHVLSVSVNPEGGARTFRFIDKKTNKKVEDFLLDDGDVVLMQGDCQDLYKHGVPKRKRVKAPRINLTFRRCRPLGGGA